MAADQTRPARASVKAHPKANSDTETSWPSEDPPNPSPTPHKGEGENSSMMQLEQRAARRENAQHNDELVLMKQGKAVGLHKDQDRLYTGAALVATTDWMDGRGGELQHWLYLGRGHGTPSKNF